LHDQLLPAKVILMVTRYLRLLKMFVRVALSGVALALYAAPAAAAGNGDAVSRCQELVPAFVKGPSRLDIQVEDKGLGQATGVRLSWPRPGGGPDEWIICWFLPRHAENDAWQMTQLDTSKYGMLRRYDIQQLYKLLRVMQYKPQDFSAEADTGTAHALYVLQQVINTISLGCVYGLIAIGFTLVYGITRVINFAFGEIYMIGAFTAFIAAIVIRVLGGSMAVPALLMVLAGTAVIMAAYGWAMDRLVFLPLRTAPTTVALIAAVGLSLALKDSVRLLQGPRTRYLLVEELDSWPVITGRGFDVFVSKGHLFVALATAAISAALWWVSTRTSFGRCQRACAQDIRMAALLGVPIDRTIGATFMIGAAIAGAGGMFAATQYGVINFHMGTLMGFKALTAALLGGIGSLPGALLGGIIIALTECFTAVVMGSQWKDIAVFVVLVLVLLCRPAGLLGTLRLPSAEERP
jgi:branched-chain amino acid transport system permease protein